MVVRDGKIKYEYCYEEEFLELDCELINVVDKGDGDLVVWNSWV